jgi:hypothetical protein
MALRQVGDGKKRAELRKTADVVAIDRQVKRVSL